MNGHNLKASNGTVKFNQLRHVRNTMSVSAHQLLALSFTGDFIHLCPALQYTFPATDTVKWTGFCLVFLFTQRFCIFLKLKTLHILLQYLSVTPSL